MTNYIEIFKKLTVAFFATTALVLAWLVTGMVSMAIVLYSTLKGEEDMETILKETEDSLDNLSGDLSRKMTDEEFVYEPLMAVDSEVDSVVQNTKKLES